MRVPDIIRDSFFGQIVYYCSGHRFLCYPEEEPGFVLPARYYAATSHASQSYSSDSAASTADSRPASITLEDSEQKAPVEDRGVRDDAGGHTLVQDVFQESALAQEYLHHDAEKGKLAAEQQRRLEEAHDDPNIVGWYGPDDPECPTNWSTLKRCVVTFDVCLITFTVYIGAALYAPGIPDMAEKFGVSKVAASLGITTFVIGYGVGPMFLSPLSEIPQLGRSPVYMVTLLLFVVIQVPTALGKNLGVVLPLRFLAGFFGSPPQATGGASIADIWGPENRAAAMGLWGLAAMSGPALGPTIGGFVAQHKGWTWTIWVLLWLGGGSMAFLTVFMPETSAQTILYHRAVRLRRLTGNNNLKSQGEIDAQHMTLGDIAMITLVRPFILGFREPIVVFWNMFIALVYGIMYCFIASFDVVFIEKHGFNLSENGLAFIGMVVGVAIAYLCFVPWALGSLKQKFKTGVFVPEDRMPLAIWGAITLPISMFWFGWTSGSNIHWISPILASALWAAAGYLLFQAGLNYLVDCYPRYAASVLAGNDLFRSMIGASFPVFSTAFFHNLGVGPACSILGGIGIIMIPFAFILWKHGAKIRAWSKYAD